MHLPSPKTSDPEQDAQKGASCDGQPVPLAPMPLAHVHCLGSPHMASDVALPGTATTMPAPSQSLCWKHGPLFVPTLKWPDAQAVQVASAVLSGDAVKYFPAGHVVCFAAQAVAAFSPTLK